MHLFTVFCAFASAAVIPIEANTPSDEYQMYFQKCCRRNEVLVKVYTFVTDYSERYECIDSDSAENTYNISLSSFVIGDSVEVRHGFPPDCRDVEITQTTDFDFHLSVSEHKCYDRLVAEVINSTIKQNIPKTVTLTCNQTETENKYSSKLKIDHFRKCCIRGQNYDINYHVCRNYDENFNESELIRRLNIEGNYIYEAENGLSCKSDQYIIDLHVRNFSFMVDGSTLTTVNKNGKHSNSLTKGEWCLEREYGGNELIAQVCTQDCSGYGAFCVRKCCPPGQHFKPRRCSSMASDCVPYVDEVDFFNMSKYTDPLIHTNIHLLDTMGIRTGLQCPDRRFVLNDSSPTDHHRLTAEGSMELSFGVINSYCLEVFDRRHCPANDIVKNGVLCFVREKKIKDFRVSFVVICISCVCLALTLLVYVSIPELRNLHGRNLICHVSMMLVAYSCLARVQYSNVEDYLRCTLLGYAIYFAFMAAFAWLHVMCFDIWWTFGSVRNVQPLRKSSSERRRFTWYSMYAWSIAILLTGTTYLLDRYPVSVHLDSNIGEGACWFGTVQNGPSDWPHYILFVIPMGIFTCTNFTLWLLTARHCAQVKSEVHRLQAGSVGDRAKRRFRIDRAKYILTGKLWIVMGAGWISELLSTIIHEPPWLWNIVDLINELQGVLIFLILVVKPKLYYLIKKRLGLQKPDPQKNATSSSGRTSSTFLSRTISLDERAHLKISSPNPKQV